MLSINKIKILIKDRKFSIKSFSKELGLTESGFLRGLEKDDMKVSTLINMAKILDVHPFVFFDAGVIKSDRDSDVISTENEYLKKLVDQLTKENEFLKELIKK